jgi:hypothetical protein
VNSKFLKGALLSFFLVVCNFANAGIIYTYTGNNFATVSGTTTTSDSVLIQLTLDIALEADLNNVDVAGFSGFGLTMSSAGYTFTDIDIFTNHSGPFESASVSANITTDALGNITEWDVSLMQFYSNFNVRRILSKWDDTLPIDAFYSTILGPVNQGFTTSPTPSNWSSRDVVKVIEPSNFAIFALGIIGLASRRFKKQS